MDTLAALLARDRRSEDPALRTGDRALDYRRLCTTAWKAGNFLRHLGVAPGRDVAVVAAPATPPVCTFLGAGLLGVATRFLPAPEVPADVRVVLVHAEDEAAVDVPPGTKLAVYGDGPDDPDVEHWEGGVWSENPAFPPSRGAPDDAAMLTERGSHSHADLLGAARRVADELGVGPGETVELRGSLTDPRAVAAGLLAPLVAGACADLSAARFGDVDAADDAETKGDVDEGDAGFVAGPDGARLSLSAVDP